MDGKHNAAMGALSFVKDGATIGLGTGSTAEEFISLLGEMVKAKGMKIVCVPTSVRTAKSAKMAGLPLREFDGGMEIDLAVDGADQVDRNMNLIKGYGGALFREKIIDCAAKRFVVIVDSSKLRNRLGGLVPLEVVEFAVPYVRSELKKFRIASAVRTVSGKKFLTDNGNPIVDAEFKALGNPRKADSMLKSIRGVVETGLFTDCVWKVVIGSERGYKIMQ